jgi:hypothetical protein
LDGHLSDGTQGSGHDTEPSSSNDSSEAGGDGDDFEDGEDDKDYVDDGGVDGEDEDSEEHGGGDEDECDDKDSDALHTPIATRGGQSQGDRDEGTPTQTRPNDDCLDEEEALPKGGKGRFKCNPKVRCQIPLWLCIRHLRVTIASCVFVTHYATRLQQETHATIRARHHIYLAIEMHVLPRLVWCTLAREGTILHEIVCNIASVFVVVGACACVRFNDTN